MNKEEKTIIIDSLTEKLQQYPHFYLTDTSGLNAAQTADLRKSCYEKKVSLVVVKNTLFIKALEKLNRAEDELVGVLNGTTAVMFTETGNLPAKLIKEFRKGKGPDAKPLLKGAYVEECVYLGEKSMEELINVKSREQLIGDIISLLQSPAKNVISALKSSSADKVAGIVKTLEERGN